MSGRVSTVFRSFSDEDLDDTAIAYDSARGEGAFNMSSTLVGELRNEFGARNRAMPMAYTSRRVPAGDWG